MWAVLTDMCELENGIWGCLKRRKLGRLCSHEGGPRSCRNVAQETRVSLFCLFAVDQCSGCGSSIIQNLGVFWYASVYAVCSNMLWSLCGTVAGELLISHEAVYKALQFSEQETLKLIIPHRTHACWYSRSDWCTFRLCLWCRDLSERLY